MFLSPYKMEEITRIPKYEDIQDAIKEASPELDILYYLHHNKEIRLIPYYDATPAEIEKLQTVQEHASDILRKEGFIV